MRIVPRAELERRERAPLHEGDPLAPRRRDRRRDRLVDAIPRETNGKFRAVKSAVGRAAAMIRVGLARTQRTTRASRRPSARASPTPSSPACSADAGGGAPNHVYAARARGAARPRARRGALRHAATGTRSASSCARGRRVVLEAELHPALEPGRGRDVDSVITHGSVLRAVADYAFLAVGAEGSVAIAEAPQHDCDFERDPAHRRARRAGALLRRGARARARDHRPAPRGGRLPRRRDRRAAAPCPAIRAATASSTSARAAPSTARASIRSASAAPTTTRARPPSTIWTAATSTCSPRPCSRPTSW